LNRHRKDRCAGPPKARGPRPWPMRKSVPASNWLVWGRPARWC